MTVCKRRQLLDLRLWNQNKTDLLLDFKWKNGLFLSYDTFVGLKITIFHFWDQQKCHSSNTAHWIQKNPRVIKFYFGFKVLNPKDENFWRRSVDNPLVIVVVTKKGCQVTDLKKSHLQDLRLWNQNKTDLLLDLKWKNGCFLVMTLLLALIFFSFKPIKYMKCPNVILVSKF